MKPGVWLLSLVSGLPVVAANAALPEYCFRADVSTVELPVEPGQTASKQFEYRYQVLRGGASTDPVIIFLPGGPGTPSITTTPDFLPLGPGFNAIFTDQRGVGCNAVDGLSDEAYATRVYAEDIVALIKKEKLTNYVLYGHSYGTVHATVTASLIEARKKNGDDITLPKALILEGTIGRAFDRGESLAAYQASWNALLARLPAPAQQALNQETPPFTTAEDAGERWGSYLQAQLYGGRFPDDSYLFYPLNLELKLRALGSDQAAQLSTLKQEVEAMTPGQGYGHTFRVLGCREVFRDFPAQYVLRSGELLQKGNYCEGVDLDRPYDSKNHPVSFPVFYFQGTDDQATPVWQAKYHFDNQPSGKAHRICR